MVGNLQVTCKVLAKDLLRDLQGRYFIFYNKEVFMEKLTVKQYAQKIGISTQRVYQLINSKSIKIETIKGKKYILFEGKSEEKKQAENKNSNSDLSVIELYKKELEYFKSETNRLNQQVEKKDYIIEQKDIQIEKVNDESKKIYQDVIKAQNNIRALENENRLLIEQSIENPININREEVIEVEKEIKKEKPKNKKKKKKKKR